MATKIENKEIIEIYCIHFNTNEGRNKYIL